jgi:hypothetical protein
MGPIKDYWNHGVEPLDAIKWQKFLNLLKNFSLSTRTLNLVVVGINLVFPSLRVENVGLPKGVVDKVMKRMFLKAMTGGWRRLPYEEIQNWYTS